LSAGLAQQVTASGWSTHGRIVANLT